MHQMAFLGTLSTASTDTNILRFGYCVDWAALFRCLLYILYAYMAGMGRASRAEESTGFLQIYIYSMDQIVEGYGQSGSRRA